MKNKTMILRNTISEVFDSQRQASIMRPEVARRLLAVLPDFGGKAVVLKGVRRSGKSTLQRQLMQRQPTEAIQVCCQLTPENRHRELRGLLRASRPAAGPARRALVITLDQQEPRVEDGLKIEVVPAWRWLPRGSLGVKGSK